MSPIAAWFVLFMGAGLVAVAMQGGARGWLLNGPDGLKRGKGVHRESQPLGFWLFFAVYLGVGLSATFHVFRVPAGHDAPLSFLPDFHSLGASRVDATLTRLPTRDAAARASARDQQ